MKKGSYIGGLLAICMLFLAMLAYGEQPTPSYRESGTILHEKSNDWALLNDGLPQDYSILNNVWNKGAAGSGPSEQKVFTESINNQFAFGWKWNWPKNGGSTVAYSTVAYPEVIYGIKPWDIGNQPYDLEGNVPFKAGSKKVTAKFNIKLQASGIYCMNFDMWAVADPNVPKDSITTEIKVWNVTKGVLPEGKKQGTLRVDGLTFDVYVQPRHIDGSGTQSNSWDYVAFVAQRPILQGTLDLSAFIAYLLQQGILTPDKYITSVELGNGITWGTGLAEISDYSIEVK